MRIFSLWFLLLSFSYTGWAQSPVFTYPDVRYDISTAVFAGVAERLDVSSEDTGPLSGQFNEDGLKFFLLGRNSSTLIQYDLSQPYDISTGSYAGVTREFFVGNEVSDVRSFVFNEDGMKLFVVGGTDRFIYEYGLSTAYSVSTASYSGSSEGLDVSSEVTEAFDLAFNDTGDVLVVLDYDQANVVEYSLTTAFDVSTASYNGASEEWSVASQENEPLGLIFSGSGDRLLVSGKDRSIVEYGLSTPYDISTASYSGTDEELAIGEGETHPHDLVFDEVGTGLSVVVALNDAVFSYHLTFQATYDENGMEDVMDIEANDGQGGTNDFSILYSLEGTDAGVFSVSDAGVLSFNESPDFENPTDADGDNIYELIIVASGTSLSTDQHVHIEVTDVPDTPIFDNDFFDVSTATYSGSSEDLTVSSEDGNPLGLSFNGDGSKLFVLGNQGDAIISYSLTNPYDVSTGTYDGESAEFSVTNEETNPLGFSFNPEGTKLYVLGATDQSIVSYTLSTAYDLSTASHDGESEELFIGNEEATALDLTFNGDGSQLFIIGDTDDAVVTYDLSANYDVSTGIYAGADKELVIEGEDNPYGLAFNDNGKRLFIVGGSGERILEYFLTEPYDLSSAMYHGDEQNLDLSDEENEPVDLTFHGSNVYVLGSSGGKVYEYMLEAVVSFIENDDLAIIDIDANDGMGGAIDEDVTYSLTGDDASLFSIAANGSLTFQETPDFETPLDEGADNIYDFNVVADNGINTTELAFKIRVDNVADVPVFETEFEGSYDVSLAQYTGTENDFITGYSYYQYGFVFSSDGMKLFIVGINQNEIREFNLAEPFKLESGLRSSGILNVSDQERRPTSLAFSDDGNKLYVTGYSDTVSEYDLSAPYELSSAEFAGDSEQLYVGNEEFSPLDIQFNQDGDRLYVTGSSRSVWEYHLTSPFDISTGTLGTELDVSDLGITPKALLFNENGSRLFVCGSNKRVYEYLLGIPYDLQSAIYSGPSRNFQIEDEQEDVQDIAFDIDGLRFYVFGGYDRKIVSYDIPAGLAISENNTGIVIEIDANDGMGGSTDTNISYTIDGTDAAQFSISSSGELTFVSAPDFENPADEDTDNVYEVTAIVSNGFNSISQRINVEVTDTDDFPVITNEIPDLYSISEILNSNVDEATFTLSEAANGFTFNPDGTKLYTLDYDEWIGEYDLSEAFNITAATLVDAQRFYVGDQDAVQTDLEFSADGLSLFTAGSNTNTLYRYNLETPFDLTTASYAGDAESFETGYALKAFTFGNNGGMLYTLSGNEMQEFDLNTPYDIAGQKGICTASLDLSANSIIMDEDGALMYVGSGSEDRLVTYSLDHPYFVVDKEIVSDDEIIMTNDIAFDAVGSKLFVVRDADEVMTEYRSDFDAFRYTENMEVVVFDVDANAGFSSEIDQNVTYTLGGVDGDLFTIDASGHISFVESPDFEAPTDDNADNQYVISVQVDNGLHAISETLVFLVEDVDDEDPAFTSETNVSIQENLTDLGYTITTNETATYTLGSSKDENLFNIQNDNELHFSAAPDFESPADGDGDNDYLVDITATDVAGNTSTMELAVTVTDEDEVAPAFTSESSVTLAENATGTFYTATANEAVTFSLAAGTDVALFEITEEGELSFTTAPDYENPVDADQDNTYEVEVMATDNNANASTLQVSVTVTDVDEIAPEFTSGTSVEFAENGIAVVYQASANETVTFSLGTSKDEELFEIDGDEVNFTLAPNFENPQDGDGDNDYLVDIIATDAAGNTATLELIITVTDLDEEAPVFESESSVTFSENSLLAAYIAQVNEAVTFTLGTSKDETLFTIEEGTINFINAPDFENPQDTDADNEYLLDVIATDASGNIATLALTITVTDLDEIAPTFLSEASISALENTTEMIYTAEADEEVTFSLGTTKDESHYELSGAALSFVDVPDFENPFDENGDNIYLVDLIAQDGAGNQTTMELEVTVTDQDEEGPVFTSSSTISVVENTAGTIYVAEADDAASYGLGEDKDEALFRLEGQDLTFLTEPDYESPLDQDANNEYQLDVLALDESGNQTTLALLVTVTDVDESGPQFTSATSVEVAEGSTGSFYIITTSEEATFSLGESKDESEFMLSGTDLSFVEVPDFENPTDENEDNVYFVDFMAVNGAGFQSVLELRVTVTDVGDNEFSITSPNQVDFEENGLTTAYFITANTEATFELGNSMDEHLFDLLGNQVSFITAPDFEDPQDLDEDNAYDIEVRATNESGEIKTKLVRISVINQDDTPIFGDINGDGEIGDGEIAGDVNGDGTIGAGEIAGDVNGDGVITAGEIAGDINGDGVINGGEGTRIEGTAEIAGDVSGDGVINNDEISGDIDGDKAITGDEVAGDANGDQSIGDNELAGDIDGNGSINDSEILGDTDGNGDINDGEVAGDANGDGDINGEEQVVLSVKQDFDFNLFPNPVDETLYLQIPPSIEVISIRISDMTGRVLEAFKSPVHSIDFSHQQAGTYLLQLETDHGTVSRLFLKH